MWLSHVYVQDIADFERRVKAFVEQIEPAVRDEMDAQTSTVATQARSAWPVDTGASQRGIAYETRAVGGVVSTVITNPVDYSWMIMKDGKNVASAELKKPFAKMWAKLVGNIERAVKRVLP